MLNIKVVDHFQWHQFNSICCSLSLSLSFIFALARCVHTQYALALHSEKYTCRMYIVQYVIPSQFHISTLRFAIAFVVAVRCRRRFCRRRRHRHQHRLRRRHHSIIISSICSLLPHSCFVLHFFLFLIHSHGFFDRNVMRKIYSRILCNYFTCMLNYTLDFSRVCCSLKRKAFECVLYIIDTSTRTRSKKQRERNTHTYAYAYTST